MELISDPNWLRSAFSVNARSDFLVRLILVYSFSLDLEAETNHNEESLWALTKNWVLLNAAIIFFSSLPCSSHSKRTLDIHSLYRLIKILTELTANVPSTFRSSTIPALFTSMSSPPRAFTAFLKVSDNFKIFYIFKFLNRRYFRIYIFFFFRNRSNKKQCLLSVTLYSKELSICSKQFIR